jgi:pSer/pThr/pTyr-binding forkhead associated (FHA) protein
MEALFVIFRADGERHDFHITPGKRYVIGRNESSDIRVPLPSVSREHAAVFFDEEDDELIIEDLGSSNGTYVNHDRIGGREELTPGDVVRIGDVPFQVVIRS